MNETDIYSHFTSTLLFRSTLGCYSRSLAVLYHIVHKVFEDFTFVLSRIEYLSHSDVQLPTWLGMELCKLSREPSWTLCTLFIDALWLWSCWLWSQSCSACFSFAVVQDLLYYLIFFLSLVFCMWVLVLLCCDKPIDANYAFVFYISLVIKKSFSCSIFLCSTFCNVSPLFVYGRSLVLIVK